MNPAVVSADKMISDVLITAGRENRRIFYVFCASFSPFPVYEHCRRSGA